MTEIELNEAIAKLLSENPVQEKAEPKSWIYRKRERACRSNRLFRLIARWYPTEQAGYKKYPNDSRFQRAAKRLTSKRARKNPGLMGKGNQYRRVLDYWMAVYDHIYVRVMGLAA